MTTHFGDNMPILPWMINYEYSRNEIRSRQYDANSAPNYLNYQANLNMHSKCRNLVLTSLSCTLGIENAKEEFIEDLLKAGVAFFTIDASRGGETDLLNLLTTIKSASLKYNNTCGRVYPIAVGLELTGLRIRTGYLENNELATVLVEEDDLVYLTANDDYRCHCSKKMIYVKHKPLLRLLKPNNLIYIDFGAIILRVLEIPNRYQNIKCEVVSGGKLRDNALVHFPNLPQELDYTIRADLLTFAQKSQVDALIISAVRFAYTVINIREVLDIQANNEIMLIAKIEDANGVDNIDEIIDAADGIIIARGELGLDVLPEKLFLIQKSIIAKCNKAGKPVICSTHLLQSMARNHLATRAEMLDVANAILDGADGLMLSEEVICGRKPMETLNVVKNICMEAESAVYQKQIVSNLISDIPTICEPAISVAITAVETAMKSNAVCIIVLTVSGRCAKLIAKFRPQCPIVAVTRYGHVARKLNICRAIIPIHYIGQPRKEWLAEIESRYEYAITFGKFSGLIKAGDPLILVGSCKEGSGFTNTIRIIFASETNCLPIKRKTCHPIED